ncbi:MAG: bifunctional tRNA (5-methylaminomethyl-2-thiouridine)(34)-methyltransferase MnmD/FAD-dependent 5-carboxymethylaminomethyl-2-thiouridine(34) oxidoreductase MnmC [Rhodocyclaceae bacterium]|nr:bifunctional tRNA (5-methylaminomethyl-2-thiouridine)(34)-methyltransferase MnmD/FAD-dependent 5-carboxymethylaminomethyl-2-thiouridine(34) oxidoreductase MnmC [Rhodocyclaceae bacterium]
MYEVITPAELSFNGDGTPYSARFDDVYHSAHGALGQASHVFLGGNQLPGRWRHRRSFTVVETGFGTGVNFLACWAAWRADPLRSDRLHFVSTEKHPFAARDLARLHGRFPDLAAQSAVLCRGWPPALPGVHRLHLDDGRVTLTLLFGDATTALARLDCAADALFLDGFSPARNPEMWSPRLCHLLAGVCAPDATLATWSVAAPVRSALTHAGFAVQRVPGFAAKREMLVGRLAARGGRDEGAVAARAPANAIVVGAGLAGSAIAERLASRGWQVDLIEHADAPGRGASGNLAGVLRPLPSLDDNRLARLTRAGTLYGLRHLVHLAERGRAPRWDACGVLHLARDGEHERKQRELVARQMPPSDYLRFVSRDEAAAIAGWPVATGGWWFPGAGWVMPPSLCAANLAACGDALRSHFGRHLARLERSGEQWLARDNAGETIATAGVVVLANGIELRDLPEADALPLRSARGQVTHLPAADGSPPQVVVCGLGYISPPVDGVRCAGASFQVEDHDDALRPSDQHDNLGRLEFMLPGYRDGLAEPALAGRVGFRAASPDRLPMVGGLAADAAGATAMADGTIERRPGLFAISGFGARGLVWSAIAAELLASRLSGEPLPLERDIVAALDPARFLLRPQRRRRSKHS